MEGETKSQRKYFRKSMNRLKPQVTRNFLTTTTFLLLVAKCLSFTDGINTPGGSPRLNQQSNVPSARVPIYLDDNKNMYIKLDVGTPPKTLKMQIDLGSSLTIITGLQSASNQERTTASFNYFECSESKTCTNHQISKSHTTTYGEAQGSLVSDTIALTDLPSIKVTEFTFLSATNAPKDLLSSGFDGTLGLGREIKLKDLNTDLPVSAHIKSFVRELMIQNKASVTKNCFSLIQSSDSIKSPTIAFGGQLRDTLSMGVRSLNLEKGEKSWNLKANETFVGDTQIMLQGEIFRVVFDNTLQGMFGDYEIINRMMDYQGLPYEVSCRANILPLIFRFRDKGQKGYPGHEYFLPFTAGHFTFSDPSSPERCRIGFTPVVFPENFDPPTVDDIKNHVIEKTLIFGNTFLASINIEFNEEDDRISLGPVPPHDT